MSIKILGFVAAVAAVATFLVGPAPASADRLCTSEPILADGACAGSTYPINTNLTASLTGGNLKIETTSGNIECSKSSMTAPVTVGAGGGSGVAVVGEVTRWLFGALSEEANNCSLGGNACTVSDGLNVPYEVVITHNAGTKGDGRFAIKPINEAWPSMIAKCGTEIDCLFTTGSVTYELTGGAGAKLLGEKTLGPEGGSACPTGKIVFKAGYGLLPKPLFVTDR